MIGTSVSGECQQVLVPADLLEQLLGEAWHEGEQQGRQQQGRVHAPADDHTRSNLSRQHSVSTSRRADAVEGDQTLSVLRTTQGAVLCRNSFPQAEIFMATRRASLMLTFSNSSMYSCSSASTEAWYVTTFCALPSASEPKHDGRAWEAGSQACGFAVVRIRLSTRCVQHRSWCC